MAALDGDGDLGFILFPFVRSDLLGYLIDFGSSLYPKVDVRLFLS